MLKQTKEKLKVGIATAGGAGILGFAGGAGIDHILAEKALDSLKAGDIKGTVAFILIFALIWIQVKGLRNEMKEVRLALTSPEAPIAMSFAKGEKRMSDIENKQSHDQNIVDQKLEDLDDRVSVLENFNKSQGGNYGNERISDH